MFKTFVTCKSSKYYALFGNKYKNKDIYRLIIKEKNVYRKNYQMYGFWILKIIYDK